MSDDKKFKSHTTIYYPREESEFLMKATRLRAEQLYGRGGSGKVSQYIIRLIKKDLKEQGVLKVDSKSRKLVPNEESLSELESQIQKKLEDSILDL